MSVESAEAFVERMKTDEEFAKRIAAAESSEQRWAVVKAEGFDFTKEEIEEATAELSEDELASVAAGDDPPVICTNPEPGEIRRAL